MELKAGRYFPVARNINGIAVRGPNKSEMTDSASTVGQARNQMSPTDTYATEAPPSPPHVVKRGARATSVRARPPRREDVLSLRPTRSRRRERQRQKECSRCPSHGVTSPATASRISHRLVRPNVR